MYIYTHTYIYKTELLCYIPETKHCKLTILQFIKKMLKNVFLMSSSLAIVRKKSVRTLLAYVWQTNEGCRGYRGASNICN